MNKNLWLGPMLAVSALLLPCLEVQAQSFPNQFKGSWCVVGDRDPSFFIDSQGASMGILQCKLKFIQSSQGLTKAGLMCTNFTGKFVDAVSLEINNGLMLLDQGGAVTKFRKCT